MKRTLPQLADDANPSPWLSEVSPRHAVWDATKSNADMVAAVYATAPDLAGYGRRVHGCSEVLVLTEHVMPDGGVFKADSAKCRVRHCPVCQRARAVRLIREMEAASIFLSGKYPKHRWLFLTLTVRNCGIHELRGVLRDMGAAWQRLIKRKEFRVVDGWLRSTEVTQGKDGPMRAHPHFHALLFVPPSYFKGDRYIKHERWVSLWRDAARLDYDPSVNIKPVKELESGLGEVIKTAAYSVKAEEIESSPDWFLEYHRQVHKLRFFAAGGVVKDCLSADEEPASDIADDQEVVGDEVGRRLLFDWQRPARRYRGRGST